MGAEERAVEVVQKDADAPDGLAGILHADFVEFLLEGQHPLRNQGRWLRMGEYAAAGSDTADISVRRRIISSHVGFTGSPSKAMLAATLWARGASRQWRPRIPRDSIPS